MSTPGQKAANLARQTIPLLQARKGETPITVLTAYTTPMARMLDPYVDILLVGDSLGMVLYGFDSTLPVSLDMMIQHGAAVTRGSNQAAVVIDMPFGSYQESKEQAFRHAARVMKETGCQAVKLEGGVDLAPTISFLVKRGIPVMGHVGLMPQSVHQIGGYKARGKGLDESQAIMEDAKAIADAGAFSIVLEGVVESLADQITQKVPVPIIGIGASANCDGQVLVAEDMLGLFTNFKPRFVKRFADLAPLIETAVAEYAEEVKTRRFPGPEHVFGAVRSKKAEPR